MAAPCHKYNKVRVPQKISVMGFDDTHAAAAARLTSYNFNPAGLARALIGQIIRPDAGLSAPREVEGFINVRDTTAPPA